MKSVSIFLGGLLLAASLSAQTVAVLRGDPAYDREYDGLFAALGLTPRHVEATEEGVRDFLADVASCGVILAEPGFNAGEAAWDFNVWWEGAAGLRRHPRV
ncbi:MAG: hypothetical protein IJQ00_12740 [Kiritimatiellae bacterium]|nr:hypothetical protein [Kiritimatiellia bacterium]